MYIQGIGLQAIYLQSSKEGAKQKERYQTKVIQTEKCKSKSPAKNFTSSKQWQYGCTIIEKEDGFIAG